MPDPVEPRRGPMTEADLRAAWVVEPPKLTAKLQVVDYDPEWPGLFRREADRIRAVLGERVVQLEHIGSTSVPGLAAKPIIDILLVVADPAGEPAWLPDLEAAGYRLVIREPDWYQHRCLKGPDTNVNLHVRARLPGDRTVSPLPRPAARPPRRPGALPAGQARAGRTGLDLCPGVRRRQDRGRRGHHRPRPHRRDRPLSGTGTGR
jgi:hypothetical protein